MSLPNLSTCTEWSITSSAGSRGLIFLASPPMLRDGVAHRRQIGHGRHAGEILQQHASRHEGDLRALFATGCHSASASMSLAWTKRPSSWRSRFSSSTRSEKGSWLAWPMPRAPARPGDRFRSSGCRPSAYRASQMNF